MIFYLNLFQDLMNCNENKSPEIDNGIQIHILILNDFTILIFFFQQLF